MNFGTISKVYEYNQNNSKMEKKKNGLLAHGHSGSLSVPAGSP
jgi:hypothetical protein